ncbi:MAG: beta-lactamase family protein [Clostridia bacterium]|nr:beta-lactamase family protein [Clostridia bacterium]
MFEHLKGFCDSFLQAGLPGFDIAVYKSGECLLRYMGGFSDLENKIKINGKERYNIYSCSKPVTCAAALKLYEKGVFSLDDKLSDYMPEFAGMTVKTESGVKAAQNPILIKHLFEMTAGFSYDTASESLLKCREETGGKCPTREAMRYLAKEPLLFEPGDRWEYSLCHDVLAALVEVLSGRKFEDYVKENIFDVLDMKSSTFMLPESEIETIAEQYRFENGRAVNVGKHIVAYKIGSEYASGGAGCISTLDDYIRFLEGLRTGKIITKETLKLMTSDRLNDSQKRTYWLAGTHGYGLGVKTPGADTRDFGWGGAANAYLAVDAEDERSVYLAAHMLSSPTQGIRNMIFRYVYAELFDKSAIPLIENKLKELFNYNLTY